MAIQEMELDPQTVGQEAFNAHKHNYNKATKIDYVDDDWSDLSIAESPSSTPI